MQWKRTRSVLHESAGPMRTQMKSLISYSTAMQPMMWNFSTIVISLAIIALAVLAVRRMAKRGLCDCHDGECSSGECAGCGAVDKMVADMERAARAQR